MVISIGTQKDLIAARQAGRAMADRIGLGLADQTRLATAISELTRNILLYAGTGICMLRDQSTFKHLRLQLEVEDHGPGIPDIEQAMSYGFSTGSGLGAGLPGVKSLLSEFRIESRPGLTRITAVIERLRK